MEKYKVRSSDVSNGMLAKFFKTVKKKLSHLFELEEVEVTFTREGNHLHYTYTKAKH